MHLLFNITGTFSVLILINMVLAFTLIFLEKRNPSSAWAWLMVLLFLPGIGFILYLLIGQNLSKSKMFQFKADEDIMMRNLLDEQKNQLQNQTIHFDDLALLDYRSMMRMLLVNDYSYITQDNSVEILTDGIQKFDSLINDIRNANDHIHMVYYIIKNDELSKRIVHELTKKARKGVRVRFLYDALGGRTLTKNFFKDLRAAGGEVSVFFPSLLSLINPRINYRNHRKIAIIDGLVGYIGGYNIGNEYVGSNKKFGYWRDTHLKLSGSSVYSLQIRFLLDWRYSTNTDLPIQDHFFPSHSGFGNKTIQIVSSGPDSKWEQIKNGYIALINSAKNTIYIQSPYFIPDDSVLEALKIACLSGIDVRIMIPNLPDHPFVYWANRSYIWELLEAGARAYEYTNGFLHAKTIVVDGKVCSVGTANWDVRSFKLNFEVNAFVYDSSVSKEMNSIFEEDCKLSNELFWEDYQNRSIRQKLNESVSRLLSPIL
ncbi:MAG: cardiolipin synthase [Tissierellales bacterium]|nr:cardiolipin synthase [Tissierellales bacterium]